MSNALLEAMATGLPCVATSVGGAAEVIRHGETGLLVKPGDTVALANSIQHLAADRQRRSSMGRAARESVSTRFGIEAVVEEIVDAYRSIGVSS
jgi:glycosyltransferase involved in cell wall biosynthesis